MKNLFSLELLLIMLTLSSPVQSANPDDGDNLYVFTNGNKNLAVYSLDKLDKITFGDDAMSVWVNNTPTDYYYSNISLMTFSEKVMQPLGVEPLKSGKNDISINYNRSSFTLEIKGDRQISGYVIYDSLGKPVMAEKRKSNSYQRSLEVLPSGIYIIKVIDNDSTQTMKVIK